MLLPFLHYCKWGKEECAFPQVHKKVDFLSLGGQNSAGKSGGLLIRVGARIMLLVQAGECSVSAL